MTAPSLRRSTGRKSSKASLDDYGRALRHLERLEIFGIKLGLDNIRKLCRALGSPQFAFRSVHIAGTNGKGSVAAMCSSILGEAGRRTGMYTSPHLQTIRERIRTDGRMISREEFAGAFLKVRDAASELEEKGASVTHFPISVTPTMHGSASPKTWARGRSPTHSTPPASTRAPSMRC